MQLKDRYYMLLDLFDIDESEFDSSTPGEIRELVLMIKALIKAERPEELIIAQEVDFTIADKNYIVKILPMSEERKWRNKVISKFSEIQKTNIDLSKIGDKGEAKKSMLSGFKYLLLNFEDDLWDLFFEYCGDELPKKEILDAAETSVVIQEEITDAVMILFNSFFLPRLVRWQKRILPLKQLSLFG